MIPGPLDAQDGIGMVWHAKYWCWAASPASLWLYMPEAEEVTLQTVVGGLHDPSAINGVGSVGDLWLTINGTVTQQIKAQTNQPIQVTISTAAGWNELVWSLPAGNFRPVDFTPTNGDWRMLSFAVQSFQVIRP